MHGGHLSSVLMFTVAAAVMACSEASPPDPAPVPEVRPRLTIVAPDDGAAFAALGVELRFRVDDAPAAGYALRWTRLS